MEFMDAVLATLKTSRGVDFSGYRRELLERRVHLRMETVGQDDPRAYLDLLGTSPVECDRLTETFAIKVSSFFRNPIVFEILEQQVLPDIIDRKKREGGDEIRIWSAGCASGEEAYSVAVALHRVLHSPALNAFDSDPPTQWATYVFGTDIDDRALSQAKAGLYERDKLASVKLEILDAYFRPKGSSYVVNQEIREMVRFSHDDLVSTKTIAPPDSVFGSFDLVLCRNVLIYFDRELQELVFEKLYASLVSEAYLVLGGSESLTRKMEGEFKTVDSRNRIYRKNRRFD